MLVGNGCKMLGSDEMSRTAPDDGRWTTMTGAMQSTSTPDGKGDDNTNNDEAKRPSDGRLLLHIR